MPLPLLVRSADVRKIDCCVLRGCHGFIFFYNITSNKTPPMHSLLNFYDSVYTIATAAHSRNLTG